MNMHNGSTRGLAGLRWRAGFLTATVWLCGFILLSIGVGLIAKSLTQVVDHPFYDAIERAGTNDWTDVLATLTKMGNVWQTQRLAVILAVVLAVWLWRRGQRWWMPLVALPATWIISRICQFGVAKIVDRDRDALSLLGTHVGAFPSGGVMRIITVTGAAVFLASYYGHWSRRRQIVGYTVVAALGVAEAYFRARLNQHWFTDVIGGLIVGWMFLGAVMATIRAFDPSPITSSVPPSEPSSPVGPQGVPPRLDQALDR